ncbi:hypothetical protein [Streptomyces sp. Ncost-T10-10d]|uniref:hypothetical protein n=1 Tax=Streptomyces sp. Ncost-T10-10d TaxID=1839774 RepID=UPI000B8A4B37|nr:hypothetical protein [Streptomyces sp. Ncost-T10-10d]
MDAARLRPALSASPVGAGAGPGGVPVNSPSAAALIAAQGYPMACHVRGDVIFDAVPVERHDRFQEEVAVPATSLGGRPTWTA